MSIILNSSLGYFNRTLFSGLPSIVSFKYRGAESATFDVKPFKLHNLKDGPATKATVTKAEALKYYETLVTIRRMESVSANLYKEKAIRGFLHLYSGQEAIAVGMHAVMRPQDSVITSYRCHAWNWLMDGTVLATLAELCGTTAGVARGKGGSMHMYGKNFYGGNGIIGAQVPMGAGVALAHKYNNDGGVNFALYGDGAANQGQIYESMNMAALWKLPCCFVCENNTYAMGTAMARGCASTDFYTRGDWLPGIWVDGMDVCATREATRYVIDHCTSGKGPIVMEMFTYRYYGHSMSDPGTSYRTREEVQEVRKTRDPIKNFREKSLAAGLITEAEVKAIDKKVKDSVDADAEKGKKAPMIGTDELAADIYKVCLDEDNIIRGIHPNNRLKHKSVYKK